MGRMVIFSWSPHRLDLLYNHGDAGGKIEFIAAREVVFLTFYQEARKVAFCGCTVNRLLVELVLHNNILFLALQYNIYSRYTVTVCTVLNVSSIFSIVLFFCEQIIYFESLYSCTGDAIVQTVCVFSM